MGRAGLRPISRNAGTNHPSFFPGPDEARCAVGKRRFAGAGEVGRTESRDAEKEAISAASFRPSIGWRKRIRASRKWYIVGQSRIRWEAVSNA